MGERQRLVVPAHVVIGQHVDVDKPWAPALFAYPATLRLNIETQSQQIARAQLRLHQRAHVQKIGLVDLAPGRRAPDV